MPTSVNDPERGYGEINIDLRGRIWNALATQTGLNPTPGFLRHGYMRVLVPGIAALTPGGRHCFAPSPLGFGIEVLKGSAEEQVCIFLHPRMALCAHQYRVGPLIEALCCAHENLVAETLVSFGMHIELIEYIKCHPQSEDHINTAVINAYGEHFAALSDAISAIRSSKAKNAARDALNEIWQTT